jgi:hypothetical protein
MERAHSNAFGFPLAPVSVDHRHDHAGLLLAIGFDLRR